MNEFHFLHILTNPCNCLFIVLICISLMTKDVRHLFICLLGHLFIFFGGMPIQILYPFLIQLFVFLLSTLLYILILDTRPLWYMIYETFLLLCGLSSHCPDSILWSTKCFNFDDIQFIFGIVVCAFDIISKKPLPDSCSWRLMSMFPSDNSVILVLTLKSLIHFELSVYMIWSKGLTSFFCMWILSCPSTIY